MIKSRGFITLLILFIISMAGCAVSKANSTPALPIDKQEQTSSSLAGEAEEKEKAPIPEEDGDSSEIQTANNEPAVDSEAAEQVSDAKLPAAPDKSLDKVKLLVTRNFGSQAILQQTVAIEKKWTVLDLLHSELEVQTKYGGGFIDSINGLQGRSGGLSGEMQDWFYYVNGICPDVGVIDYPLNPGEIIWWDYHAWKAGPANAAVIGCYPEPFLHGYKGKIQPTTIMCPTLDLTAGHSLEKALRARGVSNVKVMQMDQGLLAKRTGPTIVLGEWEQLKGSSYLAEFNQAYKRNSTGMHFNEGKLELIDINGQVKRSMVGSAGVIVATGSGLGDSCPLWLVSGTDLPGFQRALSLLLNNPEKIAGRYNVALSAGEIVSLPLY